MRKLSAFLLVILCILSVVGCSQQQPQQAQENQLLAEGNVIKIDVSSLPERYNYSFNGENAKEIIDYLSNLNLQSNFEENPSEYCGMTWVISLEYEKGDALNIYHFGNMFIRSEEGPWYKMTYEEASRFETLVNKSGNFNMSTSQTVTVSGSFTATVRDVISDYVLDTSIPSVALVTEYQCGPFTVHVGEEIGSQLQTGEAYVFTVTPVNTDYPKEVLERVSTAALLEMFPEMKVISFRLAEKSEIGLDSLRLTIE